MQNIVEQSAILYLLLLLVERVKNSNKIIEKENFRTT